MKYICPKDTTKKTKKYMAVVVSTLDATKSLSEVDYSALDTLSINLDLIDLAKSQIATDGVTITNAQMNLVPHPAIKIMKDAQTMAMTVMKEFGLTLKSRSALKVVEDEGESIVDEFARKE